MLLSQHWDHTTRNTMYVYPGSDYSVRVDVVSRRRRKVLTVYVHRNWLYRLGIGQMHRRLRESLDLPEATVGDIIEFAGWLGAAGEDRPES